MPHTIVTETCEGIAICKSACPVDCNVWVAFEDLDDLRSQLDTLDLQDLGKLPQFSRRIKR